MAKQIKIVGMKDLAANYSQEQYERREMAELNKQIEGIEKAPLSERKESRAEWSDAMANYPELVAERVEWLFNGSYGYGAMKRAEEIAKGRGNKVAAVSLLVAALEWRCPNAFARSAWCALTDHQKLAIDTAIKNAIINGMKEKL